jgi:oligopeptidase B
VAPLYAGRVDPPLPKRTPEARTLHGETIEDDYSWMRDRADPDLIDHLKAENAYTEAMTAHLDELRTRIFEEIKGRIQETDLSAPARWGSWQYGRRTEEGKQYPTYVRSPIPDGPEEVLLDQNLLAVGHDFCALGVRMVSPDHRMLAYSVDHTGNEEYVLRFRSLETQKDLAESIPSTYYSGAWSADSGYFFYTTLDQAHRPYRMWRHRLGSDPAADALVYEEADERFFLAISPTQDRRYVLCELESEVTQEVRYLPADDPLSDLRPLLARKQGVKYSAEHQHGRWLIVSDDQAPNGRLLSAPVEEPTALEVLIPHDVAVKIARVLPLVGHVVMVGRRGGLPSLTILPENGGTHELTFDEAVYSVAPGENLEYETTLLRLNYQSFLTPPTVIDIDLGTGERKVVKETPVLGDFDRSRYEQRREWARARDGTMVPISIVQLAGLVQPAPMLLYGYGAYESVLDPWFSHARLSLLDRGVVFAVAHVRGGGEMGRLWYEAGKMANKVNTFTDFIDAADHLMSSGWTTPNRLAARGISAGGLLMGAVANLAPDRFAAIVAEVPFVDVVNTMRDPTIPLTVIEWEEWGNPLIPDQYRWLMDYSPYENLRATDYPAILATAGLNDPRVAYWEPVKWVARLRTVGTGKLPVLLKVDLGVGHGGPSGRYDSWREEAFILAFILDRLGAARLDPEPAFL